MSTPTAGGGGSPAIITEFWFGNNHAEGAAEFKKGPKHPGIAVADNAGVHDYWTGIQKWANGPKGEDATAGAYYFRGVMCEVQPYIDSTFYLIYIFYFWIGLEIYSCYGKSHCRSFGKNVPQRRSAAVHFGYDGRRKIPRSGYIKHGSADASELLVYRALPVGT